MMRGIVFALHSLGFALHRMHLHSNEYDVETTLSKQLGAMTPLASHIAGSSAVCLLV